MEFFLEEIAAFSSTMTIIQSKETAAANVFVDQILKAD
jgi:hypothetical protein